MAQAALLGIAKSVLGQLSAPAFKEILLLWNADEDFEKLRQTIEGVTNYLHDAGQRESNELVVKGWLSRLRAVLYDADDLFDAIAYRVLQKKTKVGNTFKTEVHLFFSKSNPLAFKVKTTHTIKDIRERIDVIDKDMSQFKFTIKSIENEEKFPVLLRDRKETHSFVEDEGVIGRGVEREEIVKLLLPEDIRGEEKSLSVISIIGFGGLGKTTLAKFVYNDERVQSGFDMCLWGCINYLSDLKQVLVVILTSILKEKPKDNSLDQLQQKVRENLRGKKYLLVLDDVWDEDASNWLNLRPLLRYGKTGSKVLVTTRSTKVSQCLNSIKPYYQLNVLSEESALGLFMKMAFEECELSSKDSEFVSLGKKIVRKCGYVPLALATVGRMLCLKGKEKKAWLYFIEKELPEVLSDDTSNGNGNIMQVLKFSYNYLTSALKHCFAYCSMCPKDYEYSKDELVHLWIAQGFIDQHGEKSLEEVGDEYFFHMVDRCFFQEVEMFLEYGCITYTCKMHDLLHDLAITVAGTESKCITQLDSVDGGTTLRHISMESLEYSSSIKVNRSIISSHSKSLRTLLLCGDTFYFEIESLNSFLASFKVLRVLKLSSTRLKMLPDSIGELIHLRYLNLSENSVLEVLPNSICKLHHLQTLILEGCCRLKELPLDLGKLVSLRHLMLRECTQLESLPSGLAQLTSLVTLDLVMVHHRDGGLRYLGQLDNLCGVVNIELLANGWSNCIEDAKESNMSKKKKLNGMNIKMRFSKYYTAGEMTKEKEKAVLEQLEPNENLQYLMIEGYTGDILPNWVFSLSNLKSLCIENCWMLSWVSSCGLAYLTSLEELEILWCGNVRFSKHKDDQKVSAEMNNGLGVMPWKALQRLRKLEVPWQSHLQEGLQYLTSLEELNIRYYEADQVEADNQDMEGRGLLWKLGLLERLQTLEIHFSGIQCNFPKWIQYLRCLKNLKLEYCRELMSMSWGFLQNMNLHSLDFSSIRKVRRSNVDDWVAEQQTPFNSLVQLHIFGIVEDEEKWIHDIPWKLFPSLRTLQLWSIKNLKSLPDGIQHLTSLQELIIGYCKEMEGIPNWMINLSSLQRLKIVSCSPKLVERCERETGVDWHLISHIPVIDCK